MLDKLYYCLVEDRNTPGLPLLWLAIILLAVAFAAPYHPVLKLGKYLIGPVLLPRLFLIDWQSVNRRVLFWLILPFLVLACNAFIAGVLNGKLQLFKEAYFFINLVLFAVAICDVRFRAESIAFIFFLFVLRWYLFILQYRGFVFSLTASDETSVAELATFAYTFSVLMLLCVSQKRLLGAGWAMLGAIATLKRILVPAFGLALLFYLAVPKWFARKKVLMISLIIIGNIICYQFVRFAYEGGLDHFILENFDKARNHFFMGRPILHDAIWWEDWPIIRFDYGWTYERLAQVPAGFQKAFGGDVALHNEVVRCLYEIGLLQSLVVFGGFYLAAFNLGRGIVLGLALALMFNILSYFDNTLVYTHFVVALFMAFMRLANDDAIESRQTSTAVEEAGR